MEYQTLGRTGVRVSQLCLGAMMFGGRTEFEDGVAIIDKAIGSGINFIDTANVYNRGNSEEVVGEAVKRSGKRDSLVIATKVHGVVDAEDPNGRGISRRHIIQQCELSLRRLHTEWIDVYQLHRPQGDIPIDETLGALDDLVRAGKVRYIGTSNFAAWQIMEALGVSEKYRVARFISDQPPYNLLDRRIERELIPLCQSYGIGIIPWSPLGGGLLTGKYQRGEALPEDARYAGSLNPLQRRRFTEGAYDVIEGLEPIAASKEATMSQVALAWVMQQPGVTAPIIGPRTMEQLDDNLGALRIHLSDDELRAIDQVSAPGEHISGYYEGNDWGPNRYR